MNEKIILAAIILLSFVVGIQIVSWSSAVGAYDTMGILKGMLIAVFSIGIGILIAYMFLSKRVFIDKDINDKEVKTAKWKSTLDALGNDEYKIYKEILDAGGSIFQTDLITKTGFSNAKVTRVLNKLEERNLLERKRYGMTNIVSLK